MGVVRYSLIMIKLAFVLLCGYVVWSSREHPVINGVRRFEVCGKKEGN